MPAAARRRAARFHSAWASTASRYPTTGATIARQPGAARRGDADADAGEDGEHRVRERRHQAPGDEGAGERLAAALGPGLREVLDVLGEGEAGGADARVDHAVGDPVELAPQEPPRRAARRRPWRPPRRTGATSTAVVASAACGSVDRLEHRDGARVEQRRDGGRHEGTPEERRDEVAGRLGLEAVEPQEGRDDDAERDDRHGEREERRLHPERGAEVGRHDERREEEPDARDAGEQPPCAAPGGSWGRGAPRAPRRAPRGRRSWHVTLVQSPGRGRGRHRLAAP